MTKNCMLYPNLEAELKRCGVTKPELSKVIGVSRSNVYTRFVGTKEFSINEALMICTYLEKKSGKEFTVEYLFSLT